MTYSVGPEGVRDGKITIIQRNPFLQLTHETIERKGIGHPDTIADRLAANISRAYASYTVEHCDGYILHHQVDKLMIVGGKTDVSWGGGVFVDPVRVIVAGRASSSYMDEAIPVHDIVVDTINKYFSEHFPLLNINRDLVIQNLLTNNPGPGTISESTGAIANMFDPKAPGVIRGYETLVANDTSYCVSHAPLSRLEQCVLNTERYLQSEDVKRRYRWLGSDIKIMAVRNHDQVEVTTCIPQIAAYVHSLGEYRDNLANIAEQVHDFIQIALPDAELHLSVNTKDDYEHSNVYLTVTGSSLSGDIGAVGRGNRTNGLITAHRPMSLEGTNGKNPRYYSGFVYGILTRRLAQRLFRETGRDCVAEVVSQNGGPLSRPWQTTVQCDASPILVHDVIEEELADIPRITKDFLEGCIKAS